jgi:dipeptide/tripeptide permease
MLAGPHPLPYPPGNRESEQSPLKGHDGFILQRNGKEDRMTDEPRNGESTNGETANGESTNDETANGESTNDETANGESTNDETANGESTNDEMAGGESTSGGKPTWRFPRAVWVSNGLEVLERVAWYAMYIALTLYLTRNIGFSDEATGWIVGVFVSVLYFLPTLMGAWADQAGYRKSLIVSFALMTVGYTLLGAWQNKTAAIVSLVFVMLGAALFKPVITATMAKCSDEVNRARVFSIFYTAVNIGAFSGKMFARELRLHWGLEYINLLAGALSFIALIVTLLFYKGPDLKSVEETGKKAKDILKGLLHVVKDVRYIVFLIIIGGFWSTQHQSYATMPKYMLRVVGETASPEWISNVNPLVVVLLVIPITRLVKQLKPISAMLIAFIIMPLSSLAVAFGNTLEGMTGSTLHLFGQIAMHPVTLMMGVAVGMHGLAECFLQPRFFEYISKQAPDDEVGLYMGYSYLKSFFSNLLTFVLSGYLLAAYCPDPDTLRPEEMATAYDKAHYIWYVYAGIGMLAFFALLIFNIVTKKIDARQEGSDTST